jgi:hypothetical protein
MRGSHHEFRYRLARVVDGDCVLRYDNEAGKGDHRDVHDKDHEYRFKSAEQLLADFWSDIDEPLNKDREAFCGQPASREAARPGWPGGCEGCSR